ncbi:MAG: Hsp20/alpha crystallin family protein [Lachnospiraceae bacterium]|nr:Hsp20/alpha crystallin family protein [Lachnospiraceae bacterium]
MLAPSIYNGFVSDFFDDFGDMFRCMPNYVKENRAYNMSTDVKEFDDHYELDMELPGFKKEDVKAEFKNGYLTVSAKHDESKDEKNEEGKFIRKERYYGECKRSFYVGNNMSKEDIKANFENGILKLNVPKAEAKPEVEADNFISIEG